VRDDEVPVIEIVPFDVLCEKELPRIYLNAALLIRDEGVERLANEINDAATSDLKLQRNKDRFLSLPSTDEVQADAKKAAMVQCIVNRLDIQYRPGKVLYGLVYLNPIENEEENAEFSIAPVDIRPVQVVGHCKSLTATNPDKVIGMMSTLTDELGSAAHCAQRSHTIASLALRIFVPKPTVPFFGPTGPSSEIQTVAPLHFKKAITQIILQKKTNKAVGVSKEGLHL